jgi:hypothetical protein
MTIIKHEKMQHLSSALSKSPTGTIMPAQRFQGGAHSATRKVPPSLIDPDSFYRKILRVLARAVEPVATKDLTKAYNQTYGEAKKPQSINARLSELIVYDLVRHIDDNKGGGRWLVKPGLDVNNDCEVACTALQAFAKLR